MQLKRTLLAVIVILTITIPVHAQSADYPVYVVQSGDTLSSIAALFGTTTDDIITLNNISDPNSLAEGQQLLIPGLEGIQGTLVTRSVNLGETFTTLASSSSMPLADLIRINRLTSPNEVYAGATLITTQADPDVDLSPALSLQSSQTLLEAAAIHNKPAAQLSIENSFKGAWDIQDGRVLYSHQQGNEFTLLSVLPGVKNISLSKLPLVQGKTIVVKVSTTRPLTLSGSINGHPLNFFSSGENEYIALQGIYRQADIGITDFSVSGSVEEKQVFSFQQPILLVANYYPRDNVLLVDPRLLDPAVTVPEETRLKEITSPVTSTKEWVGYFKQPLDRTDCITSMFGSLRRYNDDPTWYSHGGADFAVCANNLNIYAAAPGTVVLAEMLPVRGNVVIIDHGWGVYTLYGHQSKMLVNVGDHVDAGQLIGQVGTTGRSNGPHLHWELWVGNVQVDPLDWLSTIYP